MRQLRDWHNRFPNALRAKSWNARAAEMASLEEIFFLFF
ncbi:hypothetical protein EV05_0460 [Prochlorococcus sp. MIT 0601]|nr:hypothetical protein EV05_0460 [Prochlorococcus sp. MIT 0601]